MAVSSIFFVPSFFFTATVATRPSPPLPPAAVKPLFSAFDPTAKYSTEQRAQQFLQLSSFFCHNNDRPSVFDVVNAPYRRTRENLMGCESSASVYVSTIAMVAVNYSGCGGLHMVPACGS